MGRKKKIPDISDSKLTDCCVLLEILDEVFIPRYEPDFDSDWGNRSWHVATIKKDEELQSEDYQEIPENTAAKNSNKRNGKALDNTDVRNQKSCLECGFKCKNMNILKEHISTTHVDETKNDSLDLNKKKALNKTSSDSSKTDRNPVKIHGKKENIQSSSKSNRIKRSRFSNQNYSNENMNSFSDENETDSVNNNKILSESPKTVRDPEKIHGKKENIQSSSKSNRIKRSRFSNQNYSNENMNSFSNENETDSLNDKKKNDNKRIKKINDSNESMKSSSDKSKSDSPNGKKVNLKNTKNKNTLSNSNKSTFKSPVVKLEKSISSISKILNGSNKKSSNKIGNISTSGSKKNAVKEVQKIKNQNCHRGEKRRRMDSTIRDAKKHSSSVGGDLNITEDRTITDSKRRHNISMTDKSLLNYPIITKVSSLNVDYVAGKSNVKNKLDTSKANAELETTQYTFNIEHSASSDDDSFDYSRSDSVKEIRNERRVTSPMKDNSFTKNRTTRVNKASIRSKNVIEKSKVNKNTDKLSTLAKICKITLPVITSKQLNVVNKNNCIEKMNDVIRNKVEVASVAKRNSVSPALKILSVSPSRKKSDSVIVKLEKDVSHDDTDQMCSFDECMRSASKENKSRIQVSSVKTKKPNFSKTKRPISHEHGSIPSNKCQYVSSDKSGNDSSVEVTYSFKLSNYKTRVSLAKKRFKPLPLKIEKDEDKGHIRRSLSYPLSCEYCSFRCRNDWVMKKHKLVIHNNGQYFSCEFCDYVTTQLYKFQKHQVVHSNHRPYACNMCDYKAKAKNALVAHKKTHSNLRPFKCDKCEHTSKLKQHLKLHQNVHKTDKPIACPLCDYTCKLPGQLTIHSLVHVNDKPYTCEFCYFSCKLSSNLKRHKVVHSKSRPFKCGLCHRTFKTKPLLKNHMLVHRFAKPYICNDCNLKYRSVQELKKHLKMEHGGFELKIIQE